MLANLPYECQIALRYTSAQRRSERNPMLSVISLISVSGIAIGVAALIVVLSVMNGFQKEVAARMLSMIPHIEVVDERGGLPNWEQTLAQARTNPAVSGGAPFVSLQGMLLYDETMRPVAVQGILPAAEKTVSSIGERIKDGKLEDLKAGSFNIVLGYELASKLGVKPGAKLSLLVAPQGGSSTAWTPRRQVFTVAGTFNVGHNDYDSSVALVHMDDARSVEQLTLPSGLRLSLHDLHQAPKVARELAESMPSQLMFRDWTRQNEVWFAALQSQKRMMFLILVLIIAVAAFNLVSTLVMKVNDKQADIAILRTLGASPRSIMAVFMMQGALVGVIGTAAGVISGVLVAMNVGVIMPVVEKLLGSKVLSKEIYFLSTVPSDPQWQDIVMIAGVAVALAFVATLYPSYGAARINPAESLRYE